MKEEKKVYELKNEKLPLLDMFAKEDFKKYEEEEKEVFDLGGGDKTKIDQDVELYKKPFVETLPDADEAIKAKILKMVKDKFPAYTVDNFYKTAGTFRVSLFADGKLKGTVDINPISFYMEPFFLPTPKRNFWQKLFKR
jgi:hypothetical protein